MRIAARFARLGMNLTRARPDQAPKLHRAKERTCGISRAPIAKKPRAVHFAPRRERAATVAATPFDLLKANA
jgi:hypothetical protein